MAFASGGASEGIIGHLSPALWCRHDPPVREAARAAAGGLAEKTEISAGESIECENCKRCIGSDPLTVTLLCRRQRGRGVIGKTTT